ncbi:MAG: response regulator [Dehalococcoidales bacterium]|nr:MAG: response regulator [Dehalococcoidales bacterium]
MTDGKILIVDDDQDLQRGLGVRLNANNYKVSFAMDAISAVSMARKEEPDLIILDIGLPGGDGFTVMQRLSSMANLASIPVIILTGRDSFGNEERAAAAGAKAFLQKPVDNDVLLTSIEEALQQDTAAGYQENDTDDKATLSNNKILIVDDDLDLLRGLSVRLTANNYKVSFATDGISAVSMARKEEPDLIILDIGLPGGDGFTVMQRLSSMANLASTPVIILTGRDSFSNEERAAAGGARAFLQKPVDNDVLLTNIEEALQQHTGAPHATK